MNGGETDWQLLFWLLFGLAGVVIALLCLERGKLSDDDATATMLDLQRRIKGLEHEAAIQDIRIHGLKDDLDRSEAFGKTLLKENAGLRERNLMLGTEVNELREDNTLLEGYAADLENKMKGE